MIKKILFNILTFGFILPSIALAMEQPKTGIRFNDVVSTIKDNRNGIWQGTKFGVPTLLAYRYLNDQEKAGKTTTNNRLGKLVTSASAGFIGWAGLTLAERTVGTLWDYAKWKLAGLAGFAIVHKCLKYGIGKSTKDEILEAISLDKEMLFNWKRNEDAYDSSYKLRASRFILGDKEIKETLRQYVLNINNFKQLSGNRSVNFSPEINDFFIREKITKEQRLLDGYIQKLQNIRFGIPWAKYKTDTILRKKDNDYGLQSLRKRNKLKRKITLSDIELDTSLDKWPSLKMQTMRKDDGKELVKPLRYTGTIANFRKSLFENRLVEPCADAFFSIKNKIRSCKDFVSIDSPIAWQNRTNREWLKREADWSEPYWFSNYLVLPWMIKTVFYPARAGLFDLIITLQDLKERLAVLQDVLDGKVNDAPTKDSEVFSESEEEDSEEESDY
jgi:hypothetical protein